MKRSVVIVDDSKFTVTLLNTFLSEAMQFQVAATGFNGVHAVSLYEKHRPDLLTLDLTMPVKGGREAIEEIIAKFPDARILVISSQVGPSLLECLKLGAKGYVEKPLRFEDGEFVRDFRSAIEECFK